MNTKLNSEKNPKNPRGILCPAGRNQPDEAGSLFLNVPLYSQGCKDCCCRQGEIKDFDFDYQPSINKDIINDLSTLRFIEEKKNVLFLGSPGVGKTHLATSLGIEAARKRNSVYFISCNDLITNLSNAFKENRLESKIKFYCKYKLLIIDEIGYLPITKDEANMFFQLIAKRYETKPTIITTNQPFSKWGEVFGDTTIASAIIDRLVHHSIIINIKGKSYRIKDLVQEDFEHQKSS